MSAQARRTARAEAAHRAATAPAGWYCRWPGCSIADQRQPADTVDAALAASAAHQAKRHPPEDPPADLEQQRAAWNAAGRPPLDRERSTT